MVIAEFRREQGYQIVAGGESRVAGSDNWFDVVMDYQREVRGIHTCKQVLWTECDYLSENEKQQLYENLVELWIKQQVAFFLSEFGCGKYLPVQPIYQSILELKNQALSIGPTDLRQFGDQAKRYLTEDGLVGGGLYYVYGQFAMMQVGGMAVIVSGTEAYKKHQSMTDVINTMQVVRVNADGSRIVDGQYLVLGRPLTLEQRRFVHNLFYLWGQEHWDVAVVDKVFQEIPTDRLLINTKISQEEYKNMLAEPGVFQPSALPETFNLFDLAQLLNRVFYKKFGQPLVGESEMEMYPVIQQLVADNIQELKKSLLDCGSREEYYSVLRDMLYQCQEIWAKKQGGDDFVRQHMEDLYAGRIPLGFEFDFTSDNPFSNPLGWNEGAKNYCEKHEEAYNGPRCPKCKQAEAPLHE